MFVNNDAKALSDNEPAIGFTHDSSASWVSTYAGPCLDPGCDVQHKRLYIIPVIGWLHYNDRSTSSLVLRPAIMSGTGIVGDYLSVPSSFQFIAVLQDSDDVDRQAHAIYHHRFKDSSPLAENETAEPLPN